jgi:hypothetical protein
MVDQVTFDIGGGVSAGASVLQFVQGMLTGARSATDLTLVLCGQHHSHGGYAKIPVRQIGPYKPDGTGCLDVFGSQNKGGSVMTGTSGWVGYYGYDTTKSSAPVLWWVVAWDNPYLGGNSANVRLDIKDKSRAYKVRYVVGAGNTLAPFRFQLFPAEQVSGPVIQDITDWLNG